MPRIIYIGKKTEMCGKTVYEILANLKNFGVGRVLQRKMFVDKYPEPTYYKVMQVAPQMDQELKFGRCWVKECFRGQLYPSLIEIKTYHPDYVLVPRHEEPDFDMFPVLGVDKSRIKILPKDYSCPPVMSEYFNRRKLGAYPNIYIDGVNKEKHGYDSKSLTQFKIESKFPEEIEDKEEFDYRYQISDNEKPTLPVDKKIIIERFRTGVNYDVKPGN